MHAVEIREVQNHDFLGFPKFNAGFLEHFLIASVNPNRGLSEDGFGLCEGEVVFTEDIRELIDE